MTSKFSNNAVSRLASPITAIANTFSVLPGEGVKFPVTGAGDTFKVTLVKVDGSLEIVNCTSRATDVFTVTRAQESTAALAFSANDFVTHNLTAAEITLIQTTAINAAAAAAAAGIAAAAAQATADATTIIANAALPKAGGAMTGLLVFKTGANIAAAATLALGAATGNLVHVTGTTSITAVTMSAGELIDVIFDGALTLTHHPANNNLPGGVDIQTVVGDRARYASDGTTVYCFDYVSVSGRPLNDTGPAPNRQCILIGPVDANGASDFGGATGSTTLTATGTLLATAANGSRNRVGSITNPSWNPLNVNGKMYLNLIVNNDGTCTPVIRPVASVHRAGGADVITNGQFTFNYKAMTGKVGNGSAAIQSWEVIVGEVTVAAGVVASIIWYALRRESSGRNVNTPSTTRLNFAHNLGMDATAWSIRIEAQSSDLNYSVFEKVPASNLVDSGGSVAITESCDSLNMGVIATTASLFLCNKTGASRSAYDGSKWDTLFNASAPWN